MPQLHTPLVQLSIQIPQPLRDHAADFANRTHNTLSDIMGKALDDYITNAEEREQVWQANTRGARRATR